MLSTPLDASTVIDRGRDFTEALVHATAHNMPAPWYAILDARGAQLYFRARAELDVWAAWLGATVQSTPMPAGKTHHAFDDVVLQLSVHCYCVTAGAEAALR